MASSLYRRLCLLSILLVGTSALGQSTVATGDSRTVTEPSYPAVCSTVQATKYIAQTNQLNIDPYNPTCGSTGGTQGALWCTGGTSYEPSSSAGSYVAAETLDNTAIQNALNACSSGKAVELVPGTSGQMAVVLAPWSLPTGVGLIVDPGIHVYASRNLSDYGGTNCGVLTNGTSTCTHWITAPNTTGSGLYGLGIFDGRGWDAYVGQTTAGFYANRVLAYCDQHGGATNGSPSCPNTTSGTTSYGPDGVDLVNSTNFTMYKVTVENTGDFLVDTSGGSGLTSWGVKLLAPFEVSNTDAWDPTNFTNATFTQGYISVGDNLMSVKASSGPSSNITVSNTQTGAGIGLAIGSQTQYGVTNVLVTNVVQRGNLNNVQSTGLQISSSPLAGGLVNKVTYRNDCMVDEQRSIRLYTSYGSQSGSNYPDYQNILFQNITVLPSTAPYTTGNSGTYTFQGLSGHPILAQFDNVSIQGTDQGIEQSAGITQDQYATMYLGPGVVPSALLTQFSAGTSVTTTGSAGASTPYACTTSAWKPLIGELNLKNASSNYQKSLTQGTATPYTLQVVLEPATAVNIMESPALTNPVQFLDNGVSVGSAALSGDGTFASLAITTPPAGSHVYQGYYPGDSNYPAFTFGSITVNNPASLTVPPPPGVVYQ